MNLLKADVGAALRVVGLSKTYTGSVRVLDQLDLVVAPGEVHALAGGNGSGKSTFIKVLSGYHQPDSGDVFIGDQKLAFGSSSSSYELGCRFVHQDRGLVAPSSILDNLSFNAGYPCRWGSIRGREARRRATEDLAKVGLEIDPRRPVGSLSQAEQTGVAIARALRQDQAASVRLLVLDEPTATLPGDEVRQLLDIIRTVAADDVAVLYVTHRLDEIFEVADNVTVLADGRKIGTSAVADLDHRQLITLMVGRELEDLTAATEAARPEESGGVVRVRGLSAGPLTEFSFDVRPGEVVGIAGITGSGREQVLPALFGAVPREGGSVELDGEALASFRPDLAVKRAVAYLPPDRKRQGGVMDLPARENLTLVRLRPFWRRLRFRRKLEGEEAKRWFTRMDVRPGDGQERNLSTFSGGNQQKILLAKWLRCQPRLLLLDEPTQGVDVAAKAQLHHQVLAAAAEGTAVVVSSSDADELAALCHRVLVVRDGRAVAELSADRLTVGHIGRESLGTGALTG